MDRDANIQNKGLRCYTMILYFYCCFHIHVVQVSCELLNWCFFNPVLVLGGLMQLVLVESTKSKMYLIN